MKAETPFWGLFVASGERHSVPPGLLAACAWAESGYNPGARRYEAHLKDESRGLLQLLTRTAADFGVSDSDELWEPRVNIDAGAQYLRWLYDRYREIPDETERWMFTVGAYNAGRGNINKALRLAREAMGYPASTSEALRLEPAALWQDWGVVVGFLPRVTGDSAGVTLRHVAKVVARWRGMSDWAAA